MNRVNQLIDRIIEDLEKLAIDNSPGTLLTKFLHSLNASSVLMQKSIEAHDAQILSAIDRQTSPDRYK